MISLFLLLIEAVIACAVAAVLGYALDRLNGVKSLGLITVVVQAILLLLAAFAYMSGVLQLDHLSPMDTFPPGYVGNTFVILEISIWCLVAAGCLGYFLSQMMGALVFEGVTLLAAVVCSVFSALPSLFYELPGELTVLIGVILVGALVPVMLSKAMKGKGVWPLRAAWFGLCAACWAGYWAAGRIGLLLITAPTLVIFAGAAYYVSQALLPIEPGQEKQALRTLLTFVLGTNYPYYVIDDWKNQKNHKLDKPEPRVPGDPFMQFFAGPGLVLNDCNHLAVITDGNNFRIAPPGLSFTGLFDQLYADVDLRPQLRTTTIAAETKDGIRMSIFTFMPHKIGTGGRQPVLGEPFPFDETAVLQAVTQQAIVDHKWQRDEKSMATEDVQKIPWHELVLMVGPPILKGIVVNYTCNELHTPGDPRVEIASEFRTRLKAAMAPLGIETVGGGISNIVPPDDVVEQRIKNWEARWKRRIEIEKGEIEAEITRQLEPAPAEAQLEVMNELGEILMRASQVTEEALAFQLVEALSEPDEQITSEDSLIKALLMRRRR